MSVVDRLARVFRGTFGLDPGRFSKDTAPEDVANWDSIGHMNLVANLEKEFGVQFEVDDIMEMSSAGKDPGTASGQRSEGLAGTATWPRRFCRAASPMPRPFITAVRSSRMASFARRLARGTAGCGRMAGAAATASACSPKTAPSLSPPIWARSAPASVASPSRSIAAKPPSLGSSPRPA